MCQHPWPRSSDGQATKSHPQPPRGQGGRGEQSVWVQPVLTPLIPTQGREEQILTGAGPGKPPSLVPCPHPRAEGGRLGGKEGLQRCKPAGERVSEA